MSGLQELIDELAELTDEFREMGWIEPVSPDAAEALDRRKRIVERQIREVEAEVEKERVEVEGIEL